VGFLDDLKLKYNATMVSAAPLRVDFFSHKLQDDAAANKQAADELEKRESIELKKIDSARLLAFQDAIVLITKDSSFPIKFFCAWKSILVKKRPAIQSVFVWCDETYRSIKIEQKPIGAYCLFDYLLPKFRIVVSADEHTADGERFEKNQIKYALSNNILVYAKDEHNEFYQLDNPSVVLDNSDIFWGYRPEHKQRVFIYSLEGIG
jgi:hypothetical protein